MLSIVPSCLRIGETLRALWEMTRNDEIGSNLLVSVYRAFSGLAAGSILGVAIGLAMATSRRADEFFGPLVATTLLAAEIVAGAAVHSLVRDRRCHQHRIGPSRLSPARDREHVPRRPVGASRDCLERACNGNAPLLDSVAHPAASSLLSIFTGVRIALGFCFVLTISVEMIAAKTGIGKLILLYGESGAYASMFGGLLAIVSSPTPPTGSCWRQ
jgi:NitT/TauT family transport system permease protein